MRAMLIRAAAGTVLLLLAAAAAGADDHEDYAEADFSLRLPAALSRFSRFPDVAGTAGASAAAAWGSSPNPAASAWLSQEGLSPQFARVAFDGGTRIDVASTSWSKVLEGFGTLQPSVARAWSNRAATRDGPDFEFEAVIEELQWSLKPREDTAWGLALLASQSRTVFGLGSRPLVEGRSRSVGLSGGVLRQMTESLRGGLCAEFSLSRDRTRESPPGLPARRSGDRARQFLVQPGVAWEYARNSRVYLDYEFGWFGNGTGSLDVHRLLAGVDHEVVGPLNLRAGAILDARGNASLAVGAGIFPSEHVFIDLAWQRNMFPEVRREFGRSSSLSLSVSILF